MDKDLLKLYDRPDFDSTLNRTLKGLVVEDPLKLARRRYKVYVELTSPD